MLQAVIVGDGDQDTADPSVHERAGTVPPVLVSPAPLAERPPDADPAVLGQQQHRRAAFLSAQSGLVQQPRRQPGRFLTIQAPATALPVNRVHDGGDRTEILSVVIAAAPDITARGDLAQDPLPPAQIRHHAAITPALILGERRIDLRQAHHPDDLAAVHLTSLPALKPDNTTILMPYVREPMVTHRAPPLAARHADPAEADHAAGPGTARTPPSATGCPLAAGRIRARHDSIAPEQAAGQVNPAPERRSARQDSPHAHTSGIGPPRESLAPARR